MKTLLVILAIAISGATSMPLAPGGPDLNGWTIDPMIILGAAGSVSAGSILIIGGVVSAGGSTAISTGSSAATGAMAASMVASDELLGKIGAVIGPYDAEQAARFIAEY